MERVKLVFPSVSQFSYQPPILIQHINYGNHVGNDSIISLLHDARVQFLQQYGYSELNVEGVGLIMSDITVSFKNQLFYNDQITIKVAIEKHTDHAFELYYQISITNKKEAIAVIAKSTMLFFDYENQRIAKVPENFLKKIIPET
jgi:acyl-CoA thioester hydrolase